MIALLFSIVAVILFFALLWHDRSATDRREDISLNRSGRESEGIN